MITRAAVSTVFVVGPVGSLITASISSESSLKARAAILVVCVAAMLFSLARRSRREGNGAFSWAHLLFFCSGFPALIYQIVWQRTLFTLFGSNIQSVTIVVSAFILGLGLGGLAGGALSQVNWLNPVAVFGLAEMGVAAFGLVSLTIFHSVAGATTSESLWKTGVLSFALVVVPTVLMGMTLPLLIEHLVRVSHNVGESVGGLYFANTLGSGMACFFAAGFLLRWLGQSGSVRAAATINALVGSAGIGYVFLFQAKSAKEPYAPKVKTAVNDGIALPLWLALVCAGFSGFAALSYEIIWYRLLSFSSDTAPIFACLLGSYLFGLAVGARFVERLARTCHVAEVVRFLGQALMVAAVLPFCVAPALALLSKLVPLYPTRGLALGGLVYFGMFVLAAAGALSLGTVFPLTAHLAVAPDERAGASVSYLYAVNIVGSTVGTLLVGFVLMNSFSIFQISALLLIIGGLSAVGVFISHGARCQWTKTFVATTAAVTMIVLVSAPIFSTIYERLLFKDHFPQMRLQQVVSNRSGTIGVTADGAVYGGGVYDGRFNIDLFHDVNIILRPYALSALHPAPRRVLMIGLGTGSWTQVLANHPQVEDVIVVEINPGYLPLIAQHAQVESLLRNPKVRIIIDDGRRWLSSHPAEKFDAVLMNTSYFWRNHSSTLLSTDFLRLLQTHLKDDGVLLYNATGSDDVMATGLSVFRYGVRVNNALAVSDSPLTFDRVRWRNVLANYAIDGKPIVDLSNPRQAEKFERVIAIPEDTTGRDWNSIETNAQLRARLKNRLIITDDNMGLEWP